MYILTFKKNRSKYFEEALSFAKELGADFDGETVTIKVEEYNLLNAYSVFRTLFGFIQNWKSTNATFRGEEVHPYQFILKMHNIGVCQLDNDCGNEWGCKKLNVISYKETGSGNYLTNGRYWYNYGEFRGDSWIIDKKIIREKLLKQVHKLGVNICPLYDQSKLIYSIENLPDIIKPDDVNYRWHLVPRYKNGYKIMIKDNIRHVTKLFRERYNSVGLVKL